MKKNTKFQSTPPARGATTTLKGAPEGSYISIHAPREGGDVRAFIQKVHGFVFQSTPPARGATLVLGDEFSVQIFQSTPPARGATAKMHSFTCESLTNK